MAIKQKRTEQLEILSGWKEIANHLGMGVRTVQRYERKLGLPVRRLSGNVTGAVVATKSDLDSWIRSFATEQESFNRKQKSLNVEQDSINVAQESFNKETRRVEDRVVSEIGQGRLDMRALQTEMAELSKELRIGVRNIRENVLKLHRQISEMRRRQEAIASPKDHSEVLLKRKASKPN